MTQSIADLLAERGKTHGDYAVRAQITQDIKKVLHGSPNWQPTSKRHLSPMQKETLEMIAHKMGRILAGNPDEPDHWADIAGYAELVHTRLIAAQQARRETVASPVATPAGLKRNTVNEGEPQ